MHNGQTGILDSLRKVSSGIVRLYKARLELSLLDLREEIDRIERRIILLEVMAFLVTMGCICLTGVGVVLLSRATGWPWAFGIFGLLYLVAAGIAWFWLQSQRKSRPEPFAQTLREFEKDSEQICKMLEGEDQRQDHVEQEAAAASRIAPLL